MTLDEMYDQLTELQRKENAAHDYMLACADDYWPDRYLDAQRKYVAAVDAFDTLLTQLKNAKAQAGE